MDTKWTKFKFSKFNKISCALLGCLMAALCGFNGIGALVRVELYGLQALAGDNTRTVDSTIFKENFASDIQKIIDDVSHNEIRQHMMPQRLPPLSAGLRFTKS